MAEFHGGDVNAVLRLVKLLTADDDCRLSILTVALVTACRSCGIDKSQAMPAIRDAFDDERKLVPFDSAEAVGS